MKKLVLLLVIIAAVVLGLWWRQRQSGESPLTTILPSINQNHIQLSSEAFAQGQSIPPIYTCDGQNVSPPLAIVQVPPKAKSLALIMDDPDAPSGTWTHWTWWNADPATTNLPQAGLSAGALEGTTSFGKPGYGGPCPPSGAHRYIFTLYAMDSMLELARGSNRQALERALKGHVLAQAKLMGLYQRQ